MKSTASPFGALSVAEFLRDYWQKKPLFVSGAFRDWKEPVGGDDLAGLACEEAVEARLVLRHGLSRFSLEHGPFAEERFGSLPERGVSLLLQDCDKHVVELQELLARFAFLPAHRIEDVMVSWSNPGGTVGPHVDAYDVFLVQGQGSRRWQVATRFDPGLVPDSELKVLRKFEAEQEWITRPGDLLYLPPHVAHFGESLEESLTYSVGGRALSDLDLVSQLQLNLTERTDHHHYADPDLEAVDPARRGELTGDTLQRFRRLVESSLGDERQWARLVGGVLSETKPHLHHETDVMTPDELLAQIEQGHGVRLPPGSLYRDDSQGRLLFVHGQCYEVDDPTDLCPLLTTGAFVASELAPHRGSPLLAWLASQGLLQFS